MVSERLKRKLAEAPRTPGVYLMKDGRGLVIYVGKAKSLRSRVRSYFQEGGGGARAKMANMIPRISDVEWIEAESEVDALLMEARLIKDIQPKYNENLRDGKLYPYLELTRGEDFPGVYVTRKRDNPRSKFYGPFTDTRGLRRAVQLLQRAFRFRTCTMEIRADDPKRRFQRPCLLHYIELCSAPCADCVSREAYRRQMELFARFLEGKRKRVLGGLEAEMQRAAEALDFERAAQFRDQIRALEALAKRGKEDFFPEATVPPVVDPVEGLKQLQEMLGLAKRPRSIEGVDVANLGGTDAVGSVVTFVDGRPFKSGYRRFRIKTVEGVDDYSMVGEVVRRRFRRLAREEAPFPDILLIDGGKGHLQVALRTLRRLRVKGPKVMSIAKREEVLYHGEPARELRLGREAPALRVLQYVRDEAHRFAVHYHHILRGRRIRAEI